MKYWKNLHFYLLEKFHAEQSEEDEIILKKGQKEMIFTWQSICCTLWVAFYYLLVKNKYFQLAPLLQRQIYNIKDSQCSFWIVFITELEVWSIVHQKAGKQKPSELNRCFFLRFWYDCSYCKNSLVLNILQINNKLSQHQEM